MFSFKVQRDIAGDDRMYEKIYYLSKIPSNWMKAYEYCKHNGMQLASLDTKTEADYFVLMLISNLHFFEGAGAFIGGMSRLNGSEDYWYWVKNGEHVKFSLKWLPGEPSGFLEKEYCLDVRKKRSVFGFNDIRCYDRIYQFICEQYVV